MDKINFYHKTKEFGKVLYSRLYGSVDDFVVRRFSIAFNIAKRFILGFDISISSYAINFSFSLVIFNINGYLYIGNPFKRKCCEKESC